MGLGVFEGRGAVGYDHGYEGEVFYLGLALDPNYVEGFVEGCLERIGEDYPEDETIFRTLWEYDAEKEALLELLKAECEVRPGRPPQSTPTPPIRGVTESLTGYHADMSGGTLFSLPGVHRLSLSVNHTRCSYVDHREG
jgi:hypothetical protein